MHQLRKNLYRNQGNDLLSSSHRQRSHHRHASPSAEGDRISSLSRSKGYKVDTIQDWIQAAGEHTESIEIEIDTRLRVARGIGKTETHASVEVFEWPQRRGHPDAPPPTVSDGWGGIVEAMVAVYGKVPEYAGIGRPPTLKQPQAGWQYLQVIKQRENGQVIGTRFKVVFGRRKLFYKV